MTASFIENLEASAIFFVLDVVLIVVFLPWVLKLREDRRWRPMRKALALACETYARRLAECLEQNGCLFKLWHEKAYATVLHTESALRVTELPSTVFVEIKQSYRGRPPLDKEAIASFGSRWIASLERHRDDLHRTSLLYLPSVDASLAELFTKFLQDANWFYGKAETWLEMDSRRGRLGFTAKLDPLGSQSLNHGADLHNMLHELEGALWVLKQMNETLGQMATQCNVEDSLRLSLKESTGSVQHLRKLYTRLEPLLE